MKRRDFLKKTVAVSALAGISPIGLTPQAADTTSAGREYYEMRLYRLKSATDRGLLDGYLEKALLPALTRQGIKPVGVFSEIEPKEGFGVYVVIPYPSLESYAATAGRLNADADYLKAGAEYLETPKTKPGFVRIDSWLMLAFAGLPKIELPSYCKEGKPRIFELRTYESYSEVKAQNKVDMFNAGEIDVMREVGLGPIFYGQALIGRDLPHLTYMTSAENLEAHKKHWGAFGGHPIWKKLSSDKQYADNVSHITSQMMEPAPYSQI